MRKGLAILIALVVICITISAVSAEDWNFSFGSASNSDGGSIEVNNNKLTVQGENFTIPDGYKENESARALGQDPGDNSGAKMTTCELDNGNKIITIKVIYSDGGIENVTGPEGSENTTIAGHAGFLKTEGDGILLDYGANGKMIEIKAPDQADLQALFK